MKKKIIDYLGELFPNAECELNYNKDYELLISVMLSAQTTDKRVNEVTSVLYKKYNTLEKLANADVEDVKEIIKPIGTYNKKALNIISISNKLLPLNKVPNNRTFLESLDGVGRKTANVVLSTLYNENVVAVDTHIRRISNRLGISKSNDVLKIEKDVEKYFNGENLIRIHHQLILFGRYNCKAVKPLCEDCRLQQECEFYKNMW